MMVLYATRTPLLSPDSTWEGWAIVMSHEDFAQQVREALDDLPTNEAMIAAVATILDEGSAKVYARIERGTVSIRVVEY